MKKAIFTLVLLSLGLVSCNNETSLQEFYVENQNDNQYVAFDIPASLLAGDNSRFTPEQKATLETIRKVNILGFPKKDGNKEILEQEQEKLSRILKSGKYNLLMRYGGGNRKAELYFSGEEDAIDELVVFGADEEKGFGIARVTGNDMNPGDIIKLFQTLDKDELNIEGLPNLGGMFKD